MLDASTHSQSQAEILLPAVPYPAWNITPPSRYVPEEDAWRVRPDSGSTSRLEVARWRSLDRSPREFAADTPPDSHVVKVVLRCMNVRLAIAGKVIQDGLAVPGMLHVTEPSSPVTGLFRGSYDTLHLFIPDNLVEECAQGLSGRPKPRLCSAATFTKDPVIEALARALLDVDQTENAFGPLYADYISIAVVARLLRSTKPSSTNDRPKVAELARWRLKRAIDFIEAELEQPLSLNEIAAASGLSPMHFAAQFRAATGLRPHEYLLRRRIERAQEMLMGIEQPIVNTALSVGFQTQSHFTTTFKRFVGQTPQVWRRNNMSRCA